jgi:hypothetical protein
MASSKQQVEAEPPEQSHPEEPVEDADGKKGKMVKKKKAKEDKPPPEPSATYGELFQFLSPTETFFMGVAFLFSCIHGAAQPVRVLRCPLSRPALARRKPPCSPFLSLSLLSTALCFYFTCTPAFC